MITTRVRGVAVVLRAMRWWDVEQVAALERVLFAESAWTPETFWSELAAPDRWYVVLERDGQVAGYAGLMLAGAEADVQTVAVATAAQGGGHGRVLLDALVSEASRRGARSLHLEVRADNAPAISLYESRGFERLAVRRGYYQPGDVDALVMRLRPLPAPA